MFQYLLKHMKPEQSEFVEESGRFWESLGMSRTAGRLIGWMMVCEPAHQSAAELVSALDISTGSVSTQVRMLEQLGMIERVTFRGDRSTYFHLRDHVWARMMEGEVGRLENLRKFADSAQNVLPSERPDRVTELASVTEFFINEWPALLARFAKHSGRPA